VLLATLRRPTLHRLFPYTTLFRSRGSTYNGQRLGCRVTSRERARLALIERDGDQCAICGIPPEWNGQPLTFQVDHIDGNREHDDLSNKRLLCPNCHSQTDTYAGRNIRLSRTRP